MTDNAMDDLVPQQVSGVETEIVGKEVLLYHPGATRAVYLNPTAALIWGLCDGSRPVREIVRVIGESYPEAGKGLAEEVQATLKQLRENGVLVDA
jgi:Coenzyme PQQ synthesis protein D (PqqD)